MTDLTFIICFVVGPAVSCITVHVHAEPGSATAVKLPSSSTVKERVLHFPKDRRLGRVKLWVGALDAELPVHPRRADLELELEFVAPAQGDVAVPADRGVVLDVLLEGNLNLSSLSGLGPDDLYMLSVGSRRPLPTADQRILEHVKHLSGLQVLSIDGTGITPRGLHSLRGMHRLRGLRFSREQRIGDAGLAALPELPSLEWLDCEVGATDAGLKHLARCRRLKVLRLCLDRIRGPGLSELTGLPHLEHLCLWGRTGPTDLHVQHLAGVKQLKRLTLWGGPGLSAGALRSVGSLANLEVLTFISVRGLTDDAVEYLRGLKHLRCVEFSGSSIGDDGIRVLSSLPRLEAIACVFVGREGMALLGQCRALKSLDITFRPSGSGGPATAGLDHLAGLQLLEDLAMSGLQIRDDDLNDLESLPNLKRLRVLGQNITNAGMAPIGRLEQLESLSLSIVRVTKRGLNQLNALTNLKSLAVETHPQSAGDSHATLDLSGLKSLEKLRLSLRAPDLAWQEADLAFLASLTKLRRLDLRAAKYDPISSGALKYVGALSELRYLRLPPTVFSGGDRLAFLQDLDHLTEVDLSGTIPDSVVYSLDSLPASLLGLRICTTEPISGKTLYHLRQSLPGLLTLDIERIGQDGRPIRDPRPAER